MSRLRSVVLSRRRLGRRLLAAGLMAWGAAWGAAWGGAGALAGPAAAFDPQSLMLTPVGRRLPSFSLPSATGDGPGLSSADLSGRIALLNVFASWCVPCREEHAVLVDLAGRGVPVYGLNYKDSPAAARRWLEQLGDPYVRTGADPEGAVAEDLELFGLPQTLVIDRDGTIAWVHVGAMTETDVDEVILPLIDRLRANAP